MSPFTQGRQEKRAHPDLRVIQGGANRETRLKPASERTVEEQAFYQNSLQLQRTELENTRKDNKTERLMTQSLITQSEGYLEREEGALDRLLVKAERLKQERILNQGSVWRRLLARGSGTGQKTLDEIHELEQSIKNKQDLMKMARNELKHTLSQKKTLDVHQSTLDSQAQRLDQDIAETVIEEIPAEDVKEDVFVNMSKEDLLTERSGRQAEQRILKEEVEAMRENQLQLNLKANELFDDLEAIPPRLQGLNNKLVRVGVLGNERERALDEVRKQQDALSKSAWSRFRNREDLKSLADAVKNLEANIEELNLQFVDGQAKIQAIYQDPARKLQEHQKAELDKQINGMSSKLFGLEERLRQNETEQVEITAQLSRRPTPVGRPQPTAQAQRKTA